MQNANGLVLADDATGALECASLLAGLHLDVELTLLPAQAACRGICVADTESRHLPPEQAAGRIRQWLEAAGPVRVFKKTDSTLRGNIAAELTAMLDRPIVYIPAYPALGRTVREGILFVHGVPIAESEFAEDARNPVRSSRVADLFPPDRIESIPDAAALSAALRDTSPRILICDAVTGEDIASLAVVLRDTAAQPYVAGPAGFIPLWATLAPFQKKDPPTVAGARKWLVVCGSRHRQSHRQAEFAEAMGLRVIRSPIETMDSPENVAAELARQAMAFIRDERIGAVLIMGGDTVWALWRALGLTAVTPLPEVLPGIAACVSPDNTLLFVTKAGGFGDDRIVEQVLERFKRV